MTYIVGNVIIHCFDLIMYYYALLCNTISIMYIVIKLIQVHIYTSYSTTLSLLLYIYKDCVTLLILLLLLILVLLGI